MITVAIIGLPNTGKTSLFNHLTKGHAIVCNKPNTTRDVISGQLSGCYTDKVFTLLDTPGFLCSNDDIMHSNQVIENAFHQADCVYLINHGHLNAIFFEWVKTIKKQDKKAILISRTYTSDLGIDHFFKWDGSITSLKELINLTLQICDQKEIDVPKETYEPIKKASISIVGRPNVGKSSLVNSIVNYHAVTVSSISGTTLDPIEVDSNHFNITDTAGISKQQERDSISGLAVKKTYEKIQSADIVLYVMDNVHVSKQDKAIFFYTKNIAYTPLLIILNKVDTLEDINLEMIEQCFGSGYDVLMTSAKIGLGIDKLKTYIESFYKKLITRPSDRSLTTIIKNIIDKNTTFIKNILYAKVSQYSPFTVEITCNMKQRERQYKQISLIRKALQRAIGFETIPIKLVFKQQKAKNIEAHKGNVS